MTTSAIKQATQGICLSLSGLVQGSGVRPSILRLARQFSINGFVRNTGRGVDIVAWASEEKLQRFIHQLQKTLDVDRISRQGLTAKKAPDSFAVIDSHVAGIDTEVAADIGICADCQQEINDAENRRYQYALNACIKCGPRFSVIRNIPYDRANSSYAEFNMCSRCQNEYKALDHPRFHAQLNACSECGPAYYLLQQAGERERLSDSDLLDSIYQSIQQGKIIAIKGVGGFHLYCDATSRDAISLLRERKRRPHKPLALMYQDIESAQQDFIISEAEKTALSSPQRPITLLQVSRNFYPAPNIAPGLNRMGVMLPYTALQVLIFKKLNKPLVATSANMTGTPICVNDEEALTQLFNLADEIYTHDRDIVHRVDDSVVQFVDDRMQVLRRARGFTPEAISLPQGLESPATVLAAGSQQKNTFCFSRNNKAWLSAHIGDLASVNTNREYQHEIEKYRQLFAFNESLLAMDANPEFDSSKYVYDKSQSDRYPASAVQHHHAHLASCLVDNQWPVNAGQVLGSVFDGFGLGEDGHAWGGEWFLSDYAGFQRLAHLEYVPLFGGQHAMKQPWRNLLAHLSQYFKHDELITMIGDAEFGLGLRDKPLDRMLSSLANGRHRQTSSIGRLFDAVAATLGICFEKQTYEGQAAAQLEALACEPYEYEPYHFDIVKWGAVYVLSPKDFWHSLVTDLGDGLASDIISARFHAGLANATAEMFMCLASEHEGLNTVALSGGVFQNRLFSELCVKRLEQDGFQVLRHQQIPCNDGGLSIGQAAVALARARQ